jgi:hypothetical protein
MSTEQDKFKHSKRLLKDDAHIAKQVKIAKAHGFPVKNDEAHRLHKLSGTTCGDPNCAMCGNPRKFFNEPTLQERRLFQDVEKITDRHSNGLSNDKEDLL